MKIAVCGKGGSGKSTIVVILAREFQRRGYRTLVVDADESNAGLHWMLGFATPPKPLIEFVGGKRIIQDKMATGFTTESGSLNPPLWRREEILPDDIPEAHLRGGGNCRLAATGKIGRAFEGCACPMGVVTREFMKKLRVDDNQLAIVDMEAGVEHFGRGIEASLDAVMVVVEPSLESISIAEKIQALTESAGARFAGAVLNKVRDEAVRGRLSQALEDRGISSLGRLAYHERFLDDGLAGLPVDVETTGAEAGGIVDRLLAFMEADHPQTRRERQGGM